MRRHRAVLVGLRSVGGVVEGLPKITLDDVSSHRQTAFARRLGHYDEAFLSELRRTRPAVLHAHFGHDGLKAAGLARRLGVPLIVTFHGYDVSQSVSLSAGLRPWLYGRRLPRLARATPITLAVSDYIRGRLLERGYDEEDVRTLYIGVDTDRFRPAPEPDRVAGLVLAVGRFVEKKGFADLVEAFTAVRRRAPGARLTILGDGPLRGELLARAESLRMPVQMPGAVSSDDVRSWLRRASLVVVPSVEAANGDTEGLPTILTEAMACGLPVVATRHAGIPEAVVDGATGTLVDERRPRELADAITSLLEAPERLHAFGVAARLRAEHRFNLKDQTNRLEDIYADVKGRR